MNCKPGDLAIVIGGVHSFDNIGRIVEVVRPYVSFEILAEGYFHYGEADPGDWVIKATGCPFVISRDNGTRFHGLLHVARDIHLLPIRPGDTADTEESHKKTEAA